MRIPVLIELLPGKGFRARAGDPFALTAEGATRDEVLQKLREMIQSKLTAGFEVTHLDIVVPENRLLRGIGMYNPDDPEVKEWEQAMKDYRREVEEDPDYL